MHFSLPELLDSLNDVNCDITNFTRDCYSYLQLDLDKGKVTIPTLFDLLAA